jgi:hypothetical protein
MLQVYKLIKLHPYRDMSDQEDVEAQPVQEEPEFEIEEERYPLKPEVVATGLS